MKPFNFISGSLYIEETKEMGRGVYTASALKKNMIIEIAPVIVMTKKDRSFIDSTLLHDYIFEWGNDHEGCCMALGYIPLYNHSYESNCEYEMDFKRQTITVKTVRSIKEGQELFINYNGDYNNKNPVWFDMKK